MRCDGRVSVCVLYEDRGIVLTNNISAHYCIALCYSCTFFVLCRFNLAKLFLSVSNMVILVVLYSRRAFTFLGRFLKVAAGI